MGRLTLEELRALAPWRWIGALEETLRRLDAALGARLCAPPRCAWHMRPSRFERRVLQALEMLGVARVAREVTLSLRTTPAMRRAMAHAPSGAFHVPDVVSLRLDMAWWDAARGVVRILEVDGAQHAEGPAGGAGHFFFRYDPSVAHRARCRDLLKDALVADAGGRVSLLRIPPALERPSHANNVALVRALHAWLRGPPPAGTPPQQQRQREARQFPLPPQRPRRGGGEGGTPAASASAAATPSRRRPRSTSLPPLRRPAAVNFEDERRARTAYVRARRAAAATPAEERMWRARQMMSDSRRMVRDDALRPYPPAWWEEARRGGEAGAGVGRVAARAEGGRLPPSPAARRPTRPAEAEGEEVPAKRHRRTAAVVAAEGPPARAPKEPAGKV